MEYFTNADGYKVINTEHFQPMTKDSADDHGYNTIEDYKNKDDSNNGYQMFERFEVKKDMALDDEAVENFEIRKNMALDDEAVENFNGTVFLPDFSRNDRIKMFGKDGVYSVPSGTAHNNGQGDVLKRTLVENELKNTLEQIERLSSNPRGAEEESKLAKLQGKLPELRNRLKASENQVLRNIDATHITSSSRGEAVIHGQGSGWEIDPYENMEFSKPCDRTTKDGYCLF